MVLNPVRAVDINKIFTFSLSQQHRIHKTQIADFPTPLFCFFLFGGWFFTGSSGCCHTLQKIVAFAFG